jgi:hypothetical protein
MAPFTKVRACQRKVDHCHDLFASTGRTIEAFDVKTSSNWGGARDSWFGLVAVPGVGFLAVSEDIASSRSSQVKSSQVKSSLVGSLVLQNTPRQISKCVPADTDEILVMDVLEPSSRI